jgi:hypothetical protein
LFVLVSFLAKKFSNLALMMVTLVESPFEVTLAESPLRVMPMTPTPSTMRFISLMISLCFDVVSLRYTMKVQKVLKKAKNSLNVLSNSFWFTSSFQASKALSTSRHSNTCSPFFPYWIDYSKEGPTRNHHPCWTPSTSVSPHAPTLYMVWELFHSPCFYLVLQKAFHERAYICFNSSFILGNEGRKKFG